MNDNQKREFHFRDNGDGSIGIEMNMRKHDPEPQRYYDWMLWKMRQEDRAMEPKMNLEQLEKATAQWHHDRNLINGASDKDQYMKLIQEAGELSDNICKNKDIRDDIGDMMVVLINIAERNGLTLTDCLQVAYDDIKDRKGRMVDGVFIKEGDA